MYKDRRIGVVIPAYNEERLIGQALETIPEFVDLVVVIDDGSKDATGQKVIEASHCDPRIQLLRNPSNLGVGASVVRGHEYMLEHEVDCVAVMAGDAQTDPSHLHRLLDKLIEERYDMAKGNRLLHPNATRAMPRYRLLGNMVLTLLTKFASGYWSLLDSQNGYVAFNAEILRRLDLSRIARGYDLENSMLIQLNIVHARVADVTMPAIYGEEESGIRVWRVIPRMLLTLLAGFWQRIYLKYVLYSFHPIALFFFFGALFTLWGLGIGIWVGIHSLGPESATAGSVMLSVLPFLVGSQLLLAALVLDILDEPK